MHTGEKLGRILIIVGAILMIVPLYASTPTSGHIDYEVEPYRIFFSDDPDPLAVEEPVFDYMRPRGISASESSITDLARAYDFYYDSTNPTYKIEANRVTIRVFQRHQLDDFTTSESTSRWLSGWAEPVDGRYIKDATIGLVLVEEGVLLHAPGTDADGQYLIPNTGVAYSYADFRIDASALPDNYCTPVDWDYKTETYTVEVPKYDEDGKRTTGTETRTRRVRVDGDQWCYRYRLGEPVLHRSLSQVKKQLGHWEDTPAGVLVANYSGLTHTDGNHLSVAAEVRIVEQSTEIHRDWDPGSGWDIENEETSERRYSVHVTHSVPVQILTSRDLTVRQRVIELSEGRVGIVLEFDGPPSISDRRLWSRAVFNDQQELVNVWGIYSIQGPHHGSVASNNNPVSKPRSFPVLPHLKVTASSDTPSHRYSSNCAVGYFIQPEIIAFERQRLSSERFVPGSRVNLSTSPIFRYDAIVLKNAPGPVSEILDLHGNRIPLETSVGTYRESDLSIRPVDDSSVRVHLADRHSGKALPGRIIHLSGANRSTVTTDDQGSATVGVSRRYVTAEFRGDDWTEDRSTFFGPIRRTSRVQPPTASLLAPVVELVGQWRLIGFWIVLAVFGWLWYKSR